MAEKLWPRLSDILFRQALLSRSNYDLYGLSDGAFRSLLTLVSHTASCMVWTYSAPSDGSIPDDDVVLARVVGVSKGRWSRIRPELEPFFKVRNGSWLLRADLMEEWIAISDGSLRGMLPSKATAIVEAREGRLCTYCGATDGPFDYDHILPVSKGGGDHPSNLTLACAKCNRSKGGKTLREWRGA